VYAGTRLTQGQRTPVNGALKVTEVMERMVVNFFYLNGLAVIFTLGFDPKIRLFCPLIPGQITVNSGSFREIVGGWKSG
jgi:hypothetical protein